LLGRRLVCISSLYILLALFSVYGPWDILGAYTKTDVVQQKLADDMYVKASGKIVRKEIKNDQTIYYIKKATIVCESGKLVNNSFIFKLDSDKIPNKSQINIEGKVSLFQTSRNEGGFDFKSYYNSLGYNFELKNVVVANYTSSNWASKDIFYNISKKFLEVYESCLPGEEAGFLASITIGNKSELDSELRELFQFVGIAHVLAVSGLHVSVVCMTNYRFMRKRGMSFLISGAVAGIVALLYGCITGGSVSSIRAIGMFLILILADVAGEAYDSLTALFIMAVIIIMQNPLFLKNGSFIFSFSAILGILFVAQPLSNSCRDILDASKKLIKADDGFNMDKIPISISFKNWLVQGFIFSLGINASMLPIVTNMYYETPIYSIFINIIILPLMPFLLVLGLLGGFCGMVFLPLGKILLSICHYIIYSFEFIAMMFSKLPFARYILGHHSLIAIVLYYILLFVIINIWKIRDYISANYKVQGFKCISWEKMNPRDIHYTLTKRILIVIMGIIILQFIWFAPKRQGFEVDILDVGQGDGIYICSGDGSRFFIDGGSTSNKSVGKYTLLPFLKYKGASHIDYWFLSHMDLDHVSGVLELLEEGYQIDNIVLSAEIPEGETLWTLKDLARHNGTNIVYMSRGDICGTRHLKFTCVYPFGGMTSDDINALSLSVLMEYDEDCDGVVDYSGFFGGDIGAEQEQAIAESGTIGHVNLLKVSHHGSRFSSDTGFLSVLSPDVAVISCAKVNRYGHPAAEAVERLENAAREVYYTMEAGRVRVTSGGVDEFCR